jgi:hypothetical protein
MASMSLKRDVFFLFFLFNKFFNQIPKGSFPGFSILALAFEFTTTKFHEHEIPLCIFLSRDVPCAGSMKRPILKKNCKRTTARQKYFNAAKNVKEWP